jgi:hypothetical protein
MNAPLRKSELSVIDTTGDTKYMWDIYNEDEISVARDTFNSLKEKRYIAYSVGDDGKKGEIIRRFDPSLGKIIMVPPVVGG